MSEFDVVEEWMAELRSHLDVEGLGDVDIPAMLSVVRTVAHAVVHPAGPVAMFMAGFAAARGGGSQEETASILAQISALAEDFSTKNHCCDGQGQGSCQKS